MKEPVITERLSITANFYGWRLKPFSQLGFSGILWVAEPFNEPEALIEKASG